MPALRLSSCTATFSKPSASEIACVTCCSSSCVSCDSLSRAETASRCASASLFAFARRRLLSRLDRERGVLRDRDEDVDLVAARLAAGDRLVDGEDPEQRAVGAAHRDEERVVRMPRVRVVADRQVGRERVEVARPVELAVGEEVGAALQEARVEQRVPVRDLPHLAEQRFARLVAAVDRRDDEVVPFAAVEVDHDRPERERVRRPPARSPTGAPGSSSPVRTSRVTSSRPRSREKIVD